MQRAFLVLLLSVAPLVAHAYATEVSAVITNINERTDCPPNQDILGGGMDPDDPSSLAASVLFPLDGFGDVFPTPASFTVVVRDFEGAHDAYRVAAICGSLPDREIVDATFPVPEGGVGVGTVECPFGKFAVSGGVSLGGSGFATEFTAAGSAPHFPQFLLSPDLTSRAAGEYEAPRGWKAGWRNELGSAATGNVGVVCSTFSDVVTVVEDATVEAGQTRSESVFCPEGMTALGGGGDATDRTDLRLTSSAPVFFGLPLVTVLFDRAEGPAPDPIGWRVSFRNDSGAAKSFKAAAVCAPEPAGAALAASACAALALLWRRA